MTASEESDRVWLPFGPALLAVLPFFVFGRFMLGDELVNADVLLAYRPAHAILADALRRGEIPLWTSTIGGGFPIAFSEYGWFSPLVWFPLLIGGAHAGYYMAVALHVALAGLATYGLARTFQQTRTEATLAGLIFANSLLVIGGSPLLNQATAYWVAPALLWAVARIRDWHALSPPVAATVIGLGLLGGHPQVVLIAALPAIVWAAVALFQVRALAQRYALIVLALAAVIGVAVAAVRILPTIALLDASVRRDGLATGAQALGSAHPFDLLAGFLFPSLSIPRLVGAHWAAYIGPLPVALAFLVVVRSRALRRRLFARDSTTALARRPGTAGTRTPDETVLPSSVTVRTAPVLTETEVRRIPWLATLICAGLAIAMGEYLQVSGVLGALPFFSLFRDPSRFLLWVVIGVAILAPLGVRIARDETRDWRRPIRPPRGSLRDRLGVGRLARTDRRSRGTRWWFVLGLLALLATAGASTVLTHWGDQARAFAEARTDVSNKVREATSNAQADYGPEFYRARFESGWRRVIASVDVRSPAVVTPLLALIGAGWWWAWGRGRADGTLLAGVLIVVPLLIYGQVQLPAIEANDVILAREGAVDAIARAIPDTTDVPARIFSWQPLAADFAARTQSTATADTDAETDMVSYMTLTRLIAPNLALMYAREAGARDPRIARLASVDAYENLLTREQALLAGAIGSERAPSRGSDRPQSGVAEPLRTDAADPSNRSNRPPATPQSSGAVGDVAVRLDASASGPQTLRRDTIDGGALGSYGLAQRRRAISQRWGLLASAGVGVVLTSPTLAPLETPDWIVVNRNAVPATGRVPAVDMYRLAKPWPRIFAVTSWQTAQNASEAITRAIAFTPDDGPRAVVTIAPGSVVSPPPAGNPDRVPVSVIRDVDGSLTLEVTAPTTTLVVVLDAMTPGWTATIDGKRAPIVTTNVAFRGVIVPSGAHTIVMSYEPGAWVSARALTAGALVILAAWFLNVATRDH